MKFWRPLGRPEFRKIFDFGSQHGGKLAPKSKPKSMLSSKSVFWKKHCFSLCKYIFFTSRESKLGATIDQKSMEKKMRKTKGFEIQFWTIFDRFGSHLGRPKRSQDAQKSMLKRYQNLNSFWKPLGTQFFRPKSRQEAPAPQIAAEDEVGPGLLGEDLGGGNKNLWEEESGKRWEEGQRDLECASNTPAGWAADWSPPGGSTAAQCFRSLERCDKGSSQEEQGFEIWVFW